MDIKILSYKSNNNFKLITDTVTNLLINMLKAKEINLNEFERHTEVNKDRFIAFLPSRQDTISTMNDMKKIRTIKINPDQFNVKSDLDLDIDCRYGLLEFHLIKDKVFCRIVLNSKLLISDIINLDNLLYSLAILSSKTLGFCEYSLIKGPEEKYTIFKGGVVVNNISQGPGTFDKVIGFSGFKIGEIMQEIDSNIDVLIAPKIVKELELSIKEATSMKNILEKMNLNEPRMMRDNEKLIEQATKLLEINKELLYKDITTEERYFKINLK